MKKTFLAMCMVAMGFLAVSCYDDSRLWDEVESLGDRVEKLEKDLQADVENLNALQNKVNSLETSLTEAIAAGDKAVKDALEKKLTDLETKLTAAQQAGDNAIIAELLKEKETLNAALTALQEGLTGVTTSVSKLDAALKTLEATVGKNHTDLLAELDKVDGKVDGHITDMAAALATLKDEATKAIAEAIAKIAVTKVETANGKIVLTLADGSKVEVSAPLANVENTGLVTVVEVEGVKYWAVVEADGTYKNLDVVVGHPDQKIEFQVNATTGELEYRVNGGEWIGTGMDAASQVEGAVLVTNFEESDDYITMTIGGVEVVLPKYVPTEDYSVLVKAGKQFFKYGETKVVPVSVEGISTFVVMTKPDGWKAKINGSNLSVTAPDSLKIAAGNADADGMVVLHGNTADGRCKTAVLNVSTGVGLELTIDDAGMISVKNSITALSGNDWFGYQTDFADAYIGICTVDEFEAFASFREFFTGAAEYGEFGSYGYLANVKGNLELGSFYEEGVYEVDEYSLSIADLGSSFWPSYEIEKGGRYVVWAVPQTTDILYDEYVFAYYEPVTVEPVAEISWGEITIDVTVYGSDVVYAGAVPASMFGEESGMTFDDYMEVGYGGMGPWKQFQQYGFEAMGMPYENGSKISVAELNYGPLTPGETYYVWLMPVKGSKAPADYDYEKDFKAYVYEYTTELLVEGAEPAELSINEEETNYSTMAVNVVPAEGTTVYYYFYEVGEVDDMTDQEIIADVMANCYYPTTESEVVTEEYLSDGVTKVLVAVAVSEDGKYAISTQSAYTLSYPYFEEGTVSYEVESVTLAEDGYYTAVLNVTGDANKVVLYHNYSNSYSNMSKYVMEQNTILNWADVVDGKATVTFKNRGASYSYAIVTLCKVTDGQVANLTKAVSFKIADYLPATE